MMTFRVVRVLLKPFGRGILMADPGKSTSALAISFLAGIFLAAASAVAEPAARETFDGPDKVWQLLDPRPGIQVVSHGSDASEAREGTSSERIAAIVPAGESIHFVCHVEPIRILDETEAQMWVKSNRPGVRFGAHVVLPRTIDPATHKPKAVFVDGTQYDQVARWQELSLADVPKQLAARIRVLRTTSGANIDSHEAYLDGVTLLVPGGPGASTVWTDELVVDGVEASVAGDTAAASDQNVVQTAFVPGGADRTAFVQVQDTTVFVGGKPFLPRGIEWNGEPLPFLAERGFNTVWLDRPPTPDQTAAAQRADMWFACKPPRPDSLAADGLGKSLDRVLAWNLGTPGERDLDDYRNWAELVRQKDPAPHRPILIAPQCDWQPYSKIADVLLVSRSANSNLSDADYAQWLDERALLARPNTPFWVSIPTQPSQVACDQAKALAPRYQLPPAIDQRRVESWTRAAGLHGSRGFLFTSTTPLTASNDASRQRALALESINRSLQLLEPWLTLGKQVSQATSTDLSASGAILQVERARLLVLSAPSESVPAPAKTQKPSSPTNPVFIVPGIPDSNQAFLLSPAGMQPLSTKRIAGGIQFTVDRDLADMVLLTEDQNVISSFRDRAARLGPKAARLQRDLLAARIRTAAVDAQSLQQLSVDTSDYGRAIGAANAQVPRCDATLNGGNASAAYQQASTALSTFDAATDQLRQKLTDSKTLTSFPPAGLDDNFAEQVDVQKALEPLRPGDNLLSGGEFEDLPQLMQLGWQHVSQPLPGVVPKAELSAQSPHAGRYCLQLSAEAIPASAAPQIVARPLARITSPAIHVNKNDIVEIAGWVRVPKPITGNIDGLTIVDSLGGAELALHVRQTSDWQRFRLIRGAPESSDETITFALNGLGSALVDDVTVRVLASPTARRLPATTITPTAANPESAGLPLLSAPRNQR